MPLYFDHNATTPLLPEVVDAMLPYLTTHFGNPSSAHAFGRTAKAAVERAREQVAALVDASPEEVLFTSGGTEATALALRGTLREGDRHVVTTRVEHPATARLVDALERQGLRVTRLGVQPSGLLAPDEVERALSSSPTRWLSVIHAHNETGVLQPLAMLSALTRRHGALLHADASQSAGKVPLSLVRDGVDLLTLAAHKLYGPKGVGALVVRRGVELTPQQLGAGHERGRRAGTENVASIVGFGAACVAAKRDLAELSTRLLSLRARLERGLMNAVPGLVVACADAPRLPNTTFALFPGVRGADLLARTPEVAASTGSACHDGSHDAPEVLVQLGVDPALARGAVRLTLGRSTTEQDVDDAIAALARA
ncbi:MAG: cysteine desulfurase family protein [Myxococcota bacterium]